MSRIVAALLLCLLPLLAAAQQQLYRYVDKDGRVTYTDSEPPPDAKGVQQKRLGGNFIETSEMPYAVQMAQQRNPVTLYGGACGEVCESGRALLNRRGVPFQEVDPSKAGEAEKMKKITGDLQVPVLIIGGAIMKGFQEQSWQEALDQAGYPKTPSSRLAASKREADKAAADKAAAEKTAAEKAASDKAAADKALAEKNEARGLARGAAGAASDTRK